MSRAVHGFESEGFLLGFKGEHVLAVMLPVSGGHPELAVVDVGGHHLLKTPLPVLTLSNKDQSVPRKIYGAFLSFKRLVTVTNNCLN